MQITQEDSRQTFDLLSLRSGSEKVLDLMFIHASGSNSTRQPASFVDANQNDQLLLIQRKKSRKKVF